MVGRGMIVAALLAYALVLGCVIWPAGSAPARAGDDTGRAKGNGSSPTGRDDDIVVSPTLTSREDLPLVAVGMQIQRVDWIDRYKESIDEIADLGADAVKFVVDARQENGASARIYLDLRMTPTPGQLGELIQHAKSKNLRVILMPIVLLDKPRGNNEWRGKIEPNPDFGGWSEWWNSYRDMMNHYAWIAQANGVDVLVVGSELITTETADHLDQWTRTIQSVRKIFKGRLTYSSNWDHYDHVLFWDQLDLIGMNSYWTFASEARPNPSVEQIVKRWREIQEDKLFPFLKKTGKPLLFLEIGWFSQNNVAYEPWDYTRDQPIDLELQRKLFEGFFRAWWGNPHLGGFSIWEWTPGEGGPDDNTYTPENKPAEHVIREWLKKPRWEVK